MPDEVTRKDLEDLLRDIEEGAELCVAKGICGWDLSPSVTVFIANLIEGFLDRHPYEGVDDEED